MRQFVFAACFMLLMLLGVRAASAQARIASALEQRLPDIRFDNVAFSDAMDFLRDVSGINIHVNWRAIEAVGISRDTTINVRLRSVPLRKVLELVLGEASSGSGLTFYVDQNVIEVTTREVADNKLYTRVYPVDDLLVEIPDFVGPSVNLGSSGGGGGGRGSGGGGGGGGQGLLGNGSGGNGASGGNKVTTRDDRAQALIETIQSIIQPEIWNVNGGTAAIRFWNGSLIVTAPRSVHEALGR